MKATYVKDREIFCAEITQHKKHNDEVREQYAQIFSEVITHKNCISIANDAMDQAMPWIPVAAMHSSGGIMHELQLKLTGVLVYGNMAKNCHGLYMLHSHGPEQELTSCAQCSRTCSVQDHLIANGMY